MADTIKKPAIEFIQTNRIGWTTSMTIEEITQLLPPRPIADQLSFTQTNRPINPKHVAGITRYLQDTPNWAMPSIILAATPDQIKTQDGHIQIATGQLQILDGQHRVQALSDYKEHVKSTPQKGTQAARRAKADQILQSEFPVVIFEVKDTQDHRQMFAWFARNRPIESPVREYFDNTDPFNNAAKVAATKSTILNGRVNFEKGRIEPQDPKFVTLTNLREIATIIEIGIRRPAKDTDRQACWQESNQNNLQDKLAEFFDEFLPECQPNYTLLVEPDQLDRQLVYERNATFAFDAQLIKLIANAWARWTHDYNRPSEKLSGYIGQLDVRRTSPINSLEKTLKIVNPDTKKYENARDRSWERATDLILRLALN